jgi:hypothetical protein
MAKKQRSTFWIVSAHVLTTGLAIPCLAGMASAAIIHYAGIRAPATVLAIQAAAIIVGYIGGTHYSLFFLTRAADHGQWDKCTVPSIIVFTALALIGFAWSVTQLQERSMIGIGVLVVCYVVVIAGFAIITTMRFGWKAAEARLAHEEKPYSSAEATSPGLERIDVATPRTVAKPRQARRNRSRLVAAGIGFVGGAAIGFGMMYRLGGNGGQGMADWSQPALAAMIVGGIGALLGGLFGISGV